MNTSILVIAGAENLGFYRGLQLQGKECDFRSLMDCGDLAAGPPFRLVILDCGFALDRGIHLLKEIKSLRPRTPVIFITDPTTEGTAIQVFRAGARDYFRRPFPIHELLDAIERILNITNGAREQRVPYRGYGSECHPEFLGRVMTDVPLHILRALRYIENNLIQNISLADLAQEANLSKFHFSRSFKMHIGMSPKQFVTTMRIERAKSLLMHKDVSISSVALSVGFNDPGNFERHFKKMTGVTPSSFMNFKKKSLISN